MKPVLTGARVLLRRVERADCDALLEMLREPAVAAFWSTDNAPEDFLSRETEGERLSSFVITVDGARVGWLGVAENLDPDYLHAGIDLFLTSSWQGAGIGPEAIALVCRELFDACGHHRVTIDPSAGNHRAIRAYEKVGFRRVGVMRAYERGRDGVFHDGLLMELIRGE